MKRLLSPIDVQIEITSACPQKCRHCYNYWRHEKIPRVDEMCYENLVDVINTLAKAKVVQVVFTGGEPLLRADILLPLMKDTRKLGLHFSMNSSALLVTKEIATELSRTGLKHALVSVLGPREMHNMLGGGAASFDKTIMGIQHLMRSNIPVSTNMVVSKLNLHTMFETARILRGVGIKNFCAGPMMPSCHDNIPMCLNVEECKQCLSELIRIEKEFGFNIDILEPLPRCMFSKEEDVKFARFFGNRACSAAVSSCVISSSGDIRPCVHSDVIYGNIMKEGFAEIWQKMSSWASVDILPDKCKSCLAINICEGGCRMSAKVTTGSYNGHDMYMSEPIIDHARAGVLEFGQKSCLPSPTLDDVFNINERCVIRKEIDAYLVCSTNRFECMSESGFEFIKLLKERRNFTAKEIAKVLGCSEIEILQVFERLMMTDILIISNRKEVNKNEKRK